ncbi:hypothetical protein VPH35_074077 [Triticum aestivum]
MAPTTSWVLLERMIYIEHDANETGGESYSSIVAGAAKKGVPSRQDIADANLAYLRNLKPDARFADPPELSSLRILRPTEFTPGICQHISSAYVASADKNLVALFAGPYRPGSNSKGGYLIYDAGKNSLSTIPQPPYDYNRLDVGGRRLRSWRARQDTCFVFRGSSLCWVDLSKGMVVCDLRAVIQHGAVPELRFVPLPGECPTYNRGQREQQLRPEEFRNMACVGGSIKFVTMDGYGERPGREVTMTVWTLSPDLCSWNKGTMCHVVRDIWASESHLSLALPRVLPLFPVLSVDEDDAVYLIFTDLDVAVGGRILEYKMQYLLRVDMQHNKVSYHPKSGEEMPFQLFHNEILASECNSYLRS